MAADHPVERGGCGRVLVVEDETLAALSLYTRFKSRGWAVDVASTIGEATAKLNKKPDVILVDLNLPDGDGEQILEMIRETQNPVRVLVITSVSDERRLDRIKTFRPAAMMEKPVDFSQIITQIAGN